MIRHFEAVVGHKFGIHVVCMADERKLSVAGKKMHQRGGHTILQIRTQGALGKSTSAHAVAVPQDQVTPTMNVKANCPQLLA